MVSLDDAVIARLEKGGKRYEILVDSELVEIWKDDRDSIRIDELLAIEDVFHDAKDGERPTSASIDSTFGTQNLEEIVEQILLKGTIQLTTNQRKKLVEQKRQQIINKIATEAIDPKTKLPHPAQRIELALKESKFSVDPFKQIEGQVKDAIDKLRPLIPISFETCKLAFKVEGKSMGAASRILREFLQREEWLSNGDWACVVEIPAGMKTDLMGKVAKHSPKLEVKEM